MNILIWTLTALFFGAIFRSIILEARKPPPPPEPKKPPPPPPVYTTNVQLNVTEHYHNNVHNEMKVTVIKAEPRE